MLSPGVSCCNPPASCQRVFRSGVCCGGNGSGGSVRRKAGEAFIRQMSEWIESKRSFVVETTLAGKTIVGLIDRGRAKGYSRTIVFVLLASGELCVRRLARRVEKGGHHVPENDIRNLSARAVCCAGKF